MDMQFLQDNWMLVALAVVSGAMLVWSFIGSQLSGVEQADTLKATRLYNDDALVLVFPCSGAVEGTVPSEQSRA